MALSGIRKSDNGLPGELGEKSSSLIDNLNWRSSEFSTSSGTDVTNLKRHPGILLSLTEFQDCRQFRIKYQTEHYLS
jgi:hypothetical protein